MAARLELCLLLVIEILQALFEGSNDILASMTPWCALKITPDREENRSRAGNTDFFCRLCVVAEMSGKAPEEWEIKDSADYCTMICRCILQFPGWKLSWGQPLHAVASSQSLLKSVGGQ